MYLLASTDHGQSFQGTDVSKWNVGYCVMSSEAFVESAAGVTAAWETEKQILYARIDPQTGTASPLMSAPGSGVNRKYPALAVNENGFALLAWTDGMGWRKGGASSWQVLDQAAIAWEILGGLKAFPHGVWSQRSQLRMEAFESSIKFQIMKSFCHLTEGY